MIDSTMFGDFGSNFDFVIDFGTEGMSSTLQNVSIDREIDSCLINSKSRSTIYANTSGYKRLQRFME